ncbi:hypothetical protein ACFVZR_18480 [Streptomyces sp. NPDC058316]|uniref:hypothetical protein n=1 Tax=unclassified Streptomyces TaxID=2593676 RepID=UPI0036E3E6EC
MNHSDKSAADGRSRRRRGLPVVIALVFAACAAVVIGVFARAVDDVESDLSDQEMNCCWEKGATPAWMSEQMGLRVPEAASDRRAGYKAGQRFDTGLLSFVLPSKEAEAYTGRLVPEGTRMIKNFHPKEKDYRPAAAFSRLGLESRRRSCRGCDTSACAPMASTPPKASTFGVASTCSRTNSSPAPLGSMSGRPSNQP